MKSVQIPSIPQFHLPKIMFMEGALTVPDERYPKTNLLIGWETLENNPAINSYSLIKGSVLNREHNWRRAA
jgi:hypothetical protein